MKIISKSYIFKLPIKKARGMEKLVKDLQVLDPTYTIEKFIEDAIDLKARKTTALLDKLNSKSNKEEKGNE